MVYAVESDICHKMCDAHLTPPAACKNTSGGPDSTLRVNYSAAVDAEQAVLEGLDLPQARAYWTNSEPPCRHNDWDNQRVKNNKTMLKCRTCDKKWVTSIRKRCSRFLRGACTLGDDCTLLHIHKYKNPEKAAQRRLHHQARIAAKKQPSTSEEDSPPVHPDDRICAASPAAQYTAHRSDWANQGKRFPTKPPAPHQGYEGYPPQSSSFAPAPAPGCTPPLTLLQNTPPPLLFPPDENPADDVRATLSAPCRSITHDSSICARRRTKSLTPFFLDASS
eukprot:Rhum_TRINITY_DN14475_c1_g1::Rhum_TRINITY_DN14475_c1_g1_i2::g.90032::m.90032